MKGLKNLSEVREILMGIADNLFTLKENEVKDTIDLNGKLDWVTPVAHGIMSPSPQEQLTPDSLNWGKAEQGRSFFDVFIAIAVQCGVQMGIDSQQDKIEEYKSDVKFFKAMKNEFETENKKLLMNQMPQGDTQSEILKLREEKKQLEKKISQLEVYKTSFDKMVQTIEFFKKPK